MQIYNLQFGNIISIQPNLAEVIIHPAVEMDIAMVETYHEFLLDHFIAPFALLVNKKHSYTYTFEAQQNIATLPEIRAMAILTYNTISRESTRALINQPRKLAWNAQLFTDRQEAIQWLNQQLNSPENTPSTGNNSKHSQTTRSILS